MSESVFERLLDSKLKLKEKMIQIKTIIAVLGRKLPMRTMTAQILCDMTHDELQEPDEERGEATKVESEEPEGDESESLYGSKNTHRRQRENHPKY